VLLLRRFDFELILDFSGTGDAFGDLENLGFFFSGSDGASQRDTTSSRGDDLDVFRRHGQRIVLHHGLPNIGTQLEIGGRIPIGRVEFWYRQIDHADSERVLSASVFRLIRPRKRSSTAQH